MVTITLPYIATDEQRLEIRDRIEREAFCYPDLLGGFSLEEGHALAIDGMTSTGAADLVTHILEPILASY